jgi:cytochrome o ubiquinol oxidase subunit 1
MDKTGDPWNGRTLEWATSSPAPSYNFATLPAVDSRDAFWTMKHDKNKPKPEYEDIEMPNSTVYPLLIAGAAFLAGFAIIWHIYWLAFVSVLGLVALVIIRTTSDNNEHVIPAEQVRKMEEARASA